MCFYCLKQSYLTQILCGDERGEGILQVYSAFIDKRELKAGFVFRVGVALKKIIESFIF
jgi:hypothetical protein